MNYFFAFSFIFLSLNPYGQEGKTIQIIVEADPNVERFYQSQGFITFDKVESFPKGRLLSVMEKMITNDDYKT